MAARGTGFVSPTSPEVYTAATFTPEGLEPVASFGAGFLHAPAFGAPLAAYEAMNFTAVPDAVAHFGTAYATVTGPW